MDREQEILVKEAVHETLTAIGFDLTEPHEIQEDMAYLRNLRETGKQVKSAAVKTCVGAGIAGACTILVYGFKEWLNRGGS